MMFYKLINSKKYMGIFALIYYVLMLFYLNNTIEYYRGYGFAVSTSDLLMQLVSKYFLYLILIPSICLFNTVILKNNESILQIIRYEHKKKLWINHFKLLLVNTFFICLYITSIIYFFSKIVYNIPKNINWSENSSIYYSICSETCEFSFVTVLGIILLNVYITSLLITSIMLLLKWQLNDILSWLVIIISVLGLKSPEFNSIFNFNYEKFDSYLSIIQINGIKLCLIIIIFTLGYNLAERKDLI